MGGNNITCFVNSIVKDMSPNLRDLDKSVSYSMIPNVRMSVTCDGNENGYNIDRCCWADFFAQLTSRVRYLIRGGFISPLGRIWYHHTHVHPALRR